MRQGLLWSMLLCGLLGWSAASFGESWARFRGPNGAGTASDKDIPIKFSDTEGVLWKVPITGLGKSSPVVWGDRLFLQTANKNDRERLLLCLDAKDGKQLWSQSVSGTKGPLNSLNSLATSTPATDGQRVYTVFWNGKGLNMFAYDFAGKKVWERPLGAYRAQHGAGASPIVVEDKVIFNNDQDGSAVVVAVDAKTGKVAWQTSRKSFRACYSAPFVLEKPNAAGELVVVSTAGIAGYNLQNGDENWAWKWTFEGKSLRTVGSPVYAEGLIFATSGNGEGDRHMVAVSPNNGNPSLAWESKKKAAVQPYVPTPLVRGSHLYLVSDRGFASCCVARTGETVWTERLGSGSVTASPVLIDGKIYAVNDDGVVFVFAAEPTFKLLAKNSLDEEVRASPAVADNRLYIRGREHLFCIGKK